MRKTSVNNHIWLFLRIINEYFKLYTLCLKYDQNVDILIKTSSQLKKSLINPFNQKNKSRVIYLNDNTER